MRQDTVFFDRDAVMRVYNPNLQAIEQQTMQLDSVQCVHCQQTRQLVSHGFIRKKRNRDAPAVVGKRVFCSNRYQRTGCGRTMQLYLSTSVRYFHYAGSVVVAFVLALIAGMSASQAYRQATATTASPRNAYRWRDRLAAQLSRYRSLFHQLPSVVAPAPTASPHLGPFQLLASTIEMLLRVLGEPLCPIFQERWQCPFL